jgi:hypothetical protein
MSHKKGALKRVHWKNEWYECTENRVHLKVRIRVHWKKSALKSELDECT